MIYYTPIDFCVICVLEEELSALLQVFGIERHSDRRIGSLRTWSTIFHGKHIRIVDLDEEQGVLSAGVAAAELLHAWAPWCIVSFGIAGRALLDPEDIRLGDVVIATNVDYYEPGKETDLEDGTPEPLMNLRSFGTDAPFFAKYLRVAAKECEPAWVKQGSIMSGEKKIAGDSNAVKKIIAKAKRKTFAIEMEAAGVAGAVERFRRVGAVKFLVVKGLSDDAGFDESAAGRAKLNPDSESSTPANRAKVRMQSAMNAAKALAAIAQATPVTLEISQGAHIRAGQVVSTATRLVKSLLPIVDLNTTVAALVPRVDGVPPELIIEVAVSDLMRRAKMMPPLFVHWRIRRNFHPLHWLDFATMLHLRRATSGVDGVPCHILLSDNEQIGDAERQEAAAMIKQVLPNSPRITWLSEARDLEPLIDGYIANLGLSAELAGVAPEFARKPEHFWMKYIVWATHGIGSCFLLAWNQTFPMWDLLFKVYSRQVVILYRRTLYLGGALAKSAKPGRDILISPPTYENLVECISILSDDVLGELVEHLTLNDEELMPVGGRDILIVQTHRNLLQAVDTNGPVYKLLMLMHHWNSVYFACKA